MGKASKDGSWMDSLRLDDSRSYVADIWDFERPATSRPARKD